VCGDGEYIVHTALSFRNKSFGSALDFVWACDASEWVAFPCPMCCIFLALCVASLTRFRSYAVRESSMTIKIFKNFVEKFTIKPDISAEGARHFPVPCAKTATATQSMCI
jgi:coatomer subunit beta'